MTNRQSFFSTYKLYEISIQNPTEDEIFDSLQPLDITEILYKQYEPEVDCASVKILLVDIYYDLSNLAKLFDTGTDIMPTLLDIEISLMRLYENESKLFNCKFDCRNRGWWNIAFCCSLLHACLIIISTMHILVFCKYKTDMTCTFAPNISFPISSEDTKARIDYYFNSCAESAVMLTEICNSFISMKSLVVPLLFVRIMIQSTAIHMVSTLKHRMYDETEKYNEALKRIDVNLKFIESYRGIQAHTSLVLESLDGLHARLHGMDRHPTNMHLAFEYVHETLDRIIPSIYAKDIDMYKECKLPQENTNFVSDPSLLNNGNDFANVNEIKTLTDLLNKFAL